MIRCGTLMRLKQIDRAMPGSFALNPAFLIVWLGWIKSNVKFYRFFL